MYRLPIAVIRRAHSRSAVTSALCIAVLDSLTLSVLQVFVQESPQDAAAAATRLQARGVVVDCRSKSVRFGFGVNHSQADVELALKALRSDAEDHSPLQKQHA